MIAYAYGRATLLTMQPTLAKYLWIDLETTGLDPDAEAILECAAIVTDADLVELGDPLVMVLQATPEFRDEASEFVQAMHDESGLWLACYDSRLHPDDLDAALTSLIERYEWAAEKPILAGSTVHFDRSFVESWLFVGERLHHRHLDTSSLKLAQEDACGIEFAKSGKAHRALADVCESLALTREIYARLRTTVQPRTHGF